MPKAGLARPPTALCGLLFVNVLVWGPTVLYGFVFDDLVNVVANPWIRDLGNLPRAFLSHAAGFDPGLHTSFFRPGMHTIYALVYALAGPQPWAFHSVNVALHLGNVGLVYVLTEALLERPKGRDGARSIPLVTAAIFSVHPVHTEAVAWIAGVSDLSYTFFGLGALILYVRSFEHARLAMGAGVLVFLGLLCKETAAAIPAVMLLLEWVQVRRGASAAVRGALTRLAPSIAAGGGYLALRVSALGSFAPSAAEHPYGVADLLSTAAGLLARYFGLLAAPIRLETARSIPTDAGFLDPIVLLGVIAAVGVVVLTARLGRSTFATAALGVAVLPILPVLYLPAIEGGVSLLGERYLYLPVLGAAWVLAFALDAVRRGLGAGPRGGAPASAAILLVCVPAVVARSGVWSDSLTLWTDAAAKSPGNAAAQEGLCFALYEARRFPEALSACERALALDASRVDARVNRATTLLVLGRASEAISEFDTALAMRPGDAGALVNRGLTCMTLGRTEEAIRSYRRAISVHPDNAEAHNMLGVALFRSGDPEAARSHLEEAVRLAPDALEYRTNLEVVRGASGRR